MVEELSLKDQEYSRYALYNLFASLFVKKPEQFGLTNDFIHHFQLGLPENDVITELGKEFERALLDPEYFHRVSLDFDGMFNVPGANQIFPYESCYTHRNVDGTFGRLWQEPAQDMDRILNEWKIRFAEGWALIPDHVAIELYFMGELCRLRSKAQDSDQNTLLEWQTRFFQTHLEPWIFDLLNNMEVKAETVLYRNIAKLIKAFLLEEKLSCSMLTE